MHGTDKLSFSPIKMHNVHRRTGAQEQLLLFECPFVLVVRVTQKSQMKNHLEKFNINCNLDRCVLSLMHRLKQ